MNYTDIHDHMDENLLEKLVFEDIIRWGAKTNNDENWDDMVKSYWKEKLHEKDSTVSIRSPAFS